MDFVQQLLDDDNDDAIIAAACAAAAAHQRVISIAAVAASASSVGLLGDEAEDGSGGDVRSCNEPTYTRAGSPRRRGTLQDRRHYVP